MKFALLALLLLTSDAGAIGPTDPDFSKYPASRAFESFIQTHLFHQYPYGSTRDAKSLLLYVSRFWSSRDSDALEYFVTSAGDVRNYREIYAWATVNSNNSKLTSDNLTKLNIAIAALPKNNVYPTLDQLVIVSFSDGEFWITRTCRPEDIRPIFDIIGERWETARPAK